MSVLDWLFGSREESEEPPTKRCCSLCGQPGHNIRTCPDKPREPRDHRIVANITNLDREEADRLGNAIKREKRRIAPDSKGTLANTKRKQLPRPDSEQKQLPEPEDI